MTYKLCFNSHYRFWRLIVGTKTAKFWIGTHVWKRTVYCPRSSGRTTWAKVDRSWCTGCLACTFARLYSAKLLPVGSKEVFDLLYPCGIRGRPAGTGYRCGGCWTTRYRWSCVQNMVRRSQWRLVAHLIGWAHQYCNKLINPPKNINISSSSVLCPRAGISLQTQAPRLQFCPKAGLRPQTQAPRLQFYRYEDCDYYTCSSVWKRGKIDLLSPSISKMLNGEPQYSLSKVTKPVHQQKEERNTRGPAHNLTHRNITPLWWKNKYMSNIAPYISNGCFACLAHGSTRWKMHIFRYENISMHL